MKTPVVQINLSAIKYNASVMLRKCQAMDIELTGVVKGVAGDIRVVREFIDAGISSIGDSRLKNIIKFRENGISGEIMLLRLPQILEIEQVIKYTDVCLVSELETVKALSRYASKYDKEYNVIIMVDVGDRREGLMPNEVIDFTAQIKSLSGIVIRGLGTNVGCFGGVLPSRENAGQLVRLHMEIEAILGCNLPVISGGNTATTILMNNQQIPAEVNHLRVGEAILLGTDVTNHRQVEGMKRDTFILEAAVIEVKDKPSLPEGELGYDAFGNKPEHIDRGIRKKAILAVGRQDVKIEGLQPLVTGCHVLGASSDHLIVDITDTERAFKVGDIMEFSLDYGAMLSIMTSPYVGKTYVY